MKKACVCLASLAVLWFAVPARAARIEADPNKDYWLSPNEGPWMIYVASFRGDEAYKLAHQMVYELRSQYQLPAVMFNRTEEERQKEKQRLEELRKLYGDAPLKRIRIVDEYAVMVGSYKEMDAAKKALDGLKKKKPKLSVETSGVTIATIKHREYGPNPNPKLKREEDYTKTTVLKNPFGGGFAVRNPLIADAQVAQETDFDAFWLKLNEREDYNLLKCRQPYTLVVRVYNSVSTLQPGAKKGAFGEKALQMPFARESYRWFDSMAARPGGRSVGDSAGQAHQLAQLLREQAGFEAYVLHTRESSLVTVGGFTGLDDPQLAHVRQQLERLRHWHTHKLVIGMHQLSDNPVPMEVPRAR